MFIKATCEYDVCPITFTPAVALEINGFKRLYIPIQRLKYFDANEIMLRLLSSSRLTDDEIAAGIYAASKDSKLNAKVRHSTTSRRKGLVDCWNELLGWWRSLSLGD